MTHDLRTIAGLAFELHRAVKHKLLKCASECDGVNLLHVHAVGIISEHKGITMKELAKMLSITAPSATSLVNRLVRDGSILRERDKENRKLVRLKISPAGAKMFRDKLQKSQKLVISLLSVLSEKDRKDLARIYGTLLKHLTQH